MAHQYCIVQDEGRVRIVTLNRPEVLNALHADANDELAAVNGWAMGGGFETALACDIIVAAENAVFALPEPRVGLIAGAGGVHRLPRIIPQKQALGMILTGRRVTAAEGKELGFVNEVVPAGQALSAAKRWAELILECSPSAL